MDSSDLATGHRILVALDDSQASRKAVEYTARVIAGRPDHYVHLVHVLPPTQIGEREGLVDRAHEVLEGLAEPLRASGIDGEHIDLGVLAVPTDASIVTGLLDLARDQSCSTIAVGRNSLPWYRELFHHHPADELVREANGFTLWVVE